MRLLIIGHSYVRNLYERGVTSFEFNGTLVHVRYVFKGGASYDTYLNNPELFNPIESENADVVLVILAGNSIKNSVTNYQIYRQAVDFYQRLRIIFPWAIFVAAEVENRFHKPGNRWDCPVGQDYKLRRRAINNFLLKLKEKQYLVMVAGPGRMDNQELYHDEVHLTRAGLDKYWQIIVNTIGYVIKKNQHLAN